MSTIKELMVADYFFLEIFLLTLYLYAFKNTVWLWLVTVKIFQTLLHLIGTLLRFKTILFSSTACRLQAQIPTGQHIPYLSSKKLLKFSNKYYLPMNIIHCILQMIRLALLAKEIHEVLKYSCLVFTFGLIWSTLARPLLPNFKNNNHA